MVKVIFVKWKYFLFVINFLLFYFLNNDLILSADYLKNTVIYNIDSADNLVVYEYNEKINDKNYHYIGYYNSVNDTFKKIMSNEGENIDSDVYFPSVSKDGRYITYTSNATNITNDEIGYCFNTINYFYETCSNIYIYDTFIEKSVLLKNNSEYLNGNSFVSKISKDGRFVAFESVATNNLILDSNNKCIIDNENTCINIFKYNVLSANITLISTSSDNKGGNSNSISPSISYDGEYIAFQSSASNLINSKYSDNLCKNIDELGNKICSYIYLANTKKNSLDIISKSNNNLFDDNSGNALISGDGNYVVYESYASNISDKFNNRLNVIVYDLNKNFNRIVSQKNGVLNNRDSYLKDISLDGNYIIYESSSTNLNEGGNNALYICNAFNNKISYFKNVVNSNIRLDLNNEYIYYFDDRLGVGLIDDIPPLILDNQIIYAIKDIYLDWKDKIIVEDNLSGLNEIELSLSNNLVFNNLGEYDVEVFACDNFGNFSSSKVRVIVIEKDDEGPVFTEIEEIRILKGSSTLNLSNYISAIDKVEGNTRIYIVDDGKIDLNSKGEYKVKLMSKDSSNNVTYKYINIIVYEDFNFEYYYELLLIIGVIGVIIFSIIKVK